MTKNTETHSSQEKAVDMGVADDSQENVDKIRDILFGGQMRDYESRFRALDQLVVQENARLGKDLNARLDQLDAYIKKEFSVLSEKLSGESKDRKSASEDLSSSMAEMRKTLENRIADVDEVHSAAEQEIRGRVHEQATELLEAIRNNQTSLENSLRDESRRLGDEKVARSDLAGLFSEVAMRLQRELDLPGDK
ncbi:MAG: hypothetical protein AB8G18_11230 [Gammaproteobacteria bacterium]